jgi:predicted MFS family arabinose efflux permease
VALGLVALAAIASVSSWQFAMHAISALTGLSLVLWYVFYRDLPRPTAVSGVARSRLWTITNRELVLIGAVGMIWLFLNTGFIVFVSFTPLLLIERGFSEVEAGILGSLGAWLAIVSVPVGGYLIDRTKKSSLIITTAGFSGALIIVLMLMGGPALLWVVAWGLLRALGAGGVMALAGGSLSPQGRATGFGVFFTIFYGGMFALPPLAGFLLDHFGSAQASLFLAAALQLMSAVSLGMFLILRNRMDSPTPQATP